MSNQKGPASKRAKIDGENMKSRSGEMRASLDSPHPLSSLPIEAWRTIFNYLNVEYRNCLRRCSSAMREVCREYADVTCDRDWETLHVNIINPCFTSTCTVEVWFGGQKVSMQFPPKHKKKRAAAIKRLGRCINSILSLHSDRISDVFVHGPGAILDADCHMVEWLVLMLILPRAVSLSSLHRLRLDGVRFFQCEPASADEDEWDEIDGEPDKTDPTYRALHRFKFEQALEVHIEMVTDMENIIENMAAWLVCCCRNVSHLHLDILKEDQEEWPDEIGVIAKEVGDAGLHPDRISLTVTNVHRLASVYQLSQHCDKFNLEVDLNNPSPSQLSGGMLKDTVARCFNYIHPIDNMSVLLVSNIPLTSKGDLSFYTQLLTGFKRCSHSNGCELRVDVGEFRRGCSEYPREEEWLDQLCEKVGAVRDSPMPDYGAINAYYRGDCE